MCAAEREVQRQVGQLPDSWEASSPHSIMSLFKVTAFRHAMLYGDIHVTSVAHSKARTRDNKWIVFQHYVQRCDAAIQWSVVCRLYALVHYPVLRQCDVQ